MKNFWHFAAAVACVEIASPNIRRRRKRIRQDNRYENEGTSIINCLLIYNSNTVLRLY